MSVKFFSTIAFWLSVFSGFAQQHPPAPSPPPPGFPVDNGIVILLVAGLILGISSKLKISGFIRKYVFKTGAVLILLHIAPYARPSATLPVQGKQYFLEHFDRFWVNLRGHNGEIRQILIGFYDNATDDYDPYLDIPKVETGGSMDFYSIIEGDSRRFSVQALHTFNTAKRIRLGMEIVDSGPYTIELDNTEGIFSNGQSIYLYDSFTKNIIEISSHPYSFVSETGARIDDRFILVFVPDITIGTRSNVQNDRLNIFQSNGSIWITSEHYAAVDQVEVYDVNGSLLFKKQVNDYWAEIPAYIFRSGQIILIKVSVGQFSGVLVTKYVVL